MCPVCIARTAVMVAGATSTGGILAAFTGKLKGIFVVTYAGLFRRGGRTWQQAKRKTMDPTKGVSR